jgi:hypothetical protein
MSDTAFCDLHGVLSEVPFPPPKGPLGLPTRAQAEVAFANVGMTVAAFRTDIVLQEVWVDTSCGKAYAYGTFFPEDNESFKLVED